MKRTHFAKMKKTHFLSWTRSWMLRSRSRACTVVRNKLWTAFYFDIFFSSYFSPFPQRRKFMTSTFSLWRIRWVDLYRVKYNPAKFFFTNCRLMSYGSSKSSMKLTPSGIIALIEIDVNWSGIVSPPKPACFVFFHIWWKDHI